MERKRKRERRNDVEKGRVSEIGRDREWLEKKRERIEER